MKAWWGTSKESEAYELLAAISGFNLKSCYSQKKLHSCSAGSSSVHLWSTHWQPWSWPVLATIEWSPNPPRQDLQNPKVPSPNFALQYVDGLTFDLQVLGEEVLYFPTFSVVNGKVAVHIQQCAVSIMLTTTTTTGKYCDAVWYLLPPCCSTSLEI